MMKYICSLLGILAFCAISHAQLDNSNTSTTGGRLGGSTINSGGFTRSTPGLSKPNNSFYSGRKDRLTSDKEGLDITDQEEFDVDGKKLIAAGRSSFVPLAENDTAEGRESNRRTRIIILPNLDKFLAMLEES